MLTTLKKIFAGLIVLAVVVFALSLWQSNKRASILVDNLAETASAAGQWDWSSISSDTEGTVHIRDVSFQPAGFRQRVEIDDITLSLDPLFLFKASLDELRHYLPRHMNIKLEGVRLQPHGPQDFQQALIERGYWPAVVGYLGAPGCGDNAPWAFSLSQWQAIMQGEPVTYNLNFFYEHNGDDSIDFQADTEAENLWMSSWSGQMKSAVGRNEFSFEDFLLKDLFYYHQDNGFNERRNQLCAQRYQGSFGAYRKNSAQIVQNLIRTLAGKELPDKLLNWYQRTLLPKAEFFAEFHLGKTIYLDELFSMPQNVFLAQSDIAVGLGESDPEPVHLQPISYDKVDADVLVQAYREDVLRQKQARQQHASKAKDKHRLTVKKVIGGTVARYRRVDDLTEAVGRKARLRTRKGRVINGVVRQVTGDTVIVEVHYVTGMAEFNLARRDITSVEVLIAR